MLNLPHNRRLFPLLTLMISMFICLTYNRWLGSDPPQGCEYVKGWQKQRHGL